VLNLWQHHKHFPAEVVQPLIDLANPDHPFHKEVEEKEVSILRNDFRVCHC
jgi:hypothetical protein